MAQLNGLEILVVEDVVDNQDLFRLFLEAAGARVDIANNGQHALEIVCDKYDVILMDIQMPVLDGLSATRALRGRGIETPIIALTAHAMPEEVAKSIAAGCVDHVLKPVSSSKLVAAISRALGR
jgi:two-component system sensor histidine kinase/response regulator